MLDKTQWCSPSNPQGRCRPESYQGADVCKPMTFAAAALFKELQELVSRSMVRRGEMAVSVDGRLGVNTLSAVNLLVEPGFRNCNDLAAHADEVVADLTRLLNGASVPARAPSSKSRWWLLATGVVIVALVAKSKEGKR